MSVVDFLMELFAFLARVCLQRDSLWAGILGLGRLRPQACLLIEYPGRVFAGWGSIDLAPPVGLLEAFFCPHCRGGSCRSLELRIRCDCLLAGNREEHGYGMRVTLGALSVGLHPWPRLGECGNPIHPVRDLYCTLDI